jgi:hypothetical protein
MTKGVVMPLQTACLKFGVKYPYLKACKTFSRAFCTKPPPCRASSQRVARPLGVVFPMYSINSHGDSANFRSMSMFRPNVGVLKPCTPGIPTVRFSDSAASSTFWRMAGSRIAVRRFSVPGDTCCHKARFKPSFFSPSAKTSPAMSFFNTSSKYIPIAMP